MKPIVAITVGDFNGIGPEIALKSLAMATVRRRCRPVLVGPPAVFHYYASMLSVRTRFTPFTGRMTKEPSGAGRAIVAEYVATSGSPRITPGHESTQAGRTAMESISSSLKLLASGEADALVTSPLSKHALHRAGISFPGQTELLLRRTGSRRVAMMMVSRSLRLGLVTLHEPLRRVPALLTSGRIREVVTIVRESLIGDFQIPSPRLVVLGVNPHAGEGGDIGTEETRVVARAIGSLRRSGYAIEGPLPADGFFGHYRPGRCDAVIAMYHDQGLIPFKILARKGGVNFSAGLNIVRTSPAHGTAFDIAGTGTADAASMAEAITLAAHLARRRWAATEGNKR